MKHTHLADDAHLADVKRTPQGWRGADWLTLAGGAGLWLASRGHPSLAVRLGGAITAAAIVSKTAIGRRGLAKVIDALPFRHRMS